MASIPSALWRIKSHLDEHLSPEQVRSACVAAGHRWRDRVLDPATTVRLFVIQVLHGNVACRALRHLGGLTASTNAYCNARARLPLEALGTLAASVGASMRDASADVGRWRGHRLWLIDGSSTSLPDAAGLQRVFGQPAAMKPGCGFPVAHVLMLMDAYTGFIADMLVGAWSTRDIAQASATHASMGEGDVLVGDRAFGSYAHFALLLQRNLHGLCRMHQSRTPAVPLTDRPAPPTATARTLRNLGPGDLLVELTRPRDRDQPAWMSDEDWAAMPESITLRQVSYRVKRAGGRTRAVTLLTTLTDAEAYPKKALTELYRSRWEIETNFRHLKTTMGMDTLRCKTPEGVTRELWVYVLVYNLVRRVMLDEARRRGVSPRRVSFIDALDAVRYGDGHGVAALTINPDRPGRMQPRVIKRPKDRYTYMTRPRDDLKQALLVTNKGTDA